MGRNEIQKACFLCFIVVVLVLQYLPSAVYCGRSIQVGLGEEKDSYGSSTPQTGSPPYSSTPKSPPCPTPSHGNSGHSSPKPPSHGDGYSTPKTPSHGDGYSTPKAPSHGSSPVYHYTPPSYDGGSSGSGSPPYSIPTPTVPSPPVSDPTVPPYHPGTCSYWFSHPDKIVAVIGYFGTVGDFFGAACVFAYGGKNPTLHDVLAHTNTDAISALIREGTAALLNSIACKTFPLSQQQVKSSLLGAIGNVGSASAQATVFKSANEGKYKS